MILVRTPLRISLFGGGSDLPSYYNENHGVVLSTTINQYMYIALCKTSYKGIKVVYDQIDLARNLEGVMHSRVRESLRYFGVTSNIEISSFAEIPTKGTGLGSSSTFTVGLINGLSHLTGRKLSQYDIAELACDIEINKCHEPIGKQDQYAATYGGLNLIHFDPKGVTVAKPAFTGDTVERLDSNLMMFYTGISRSTSDILKPISEKKDKKHFARMGKMVEQAGTAFEYLNAGDVDSVGSLLHDAWMLKREMGAGVTTDTIDSYYATAIKNGAYGGKLLGAGGGGFLLFYVPQSRQEQVREAMAKEWSLKEFKFNFDNTGTTVVYDEGSKYIS